MAEDEGNKDEGNKDEGNAEKFTMEEFKAGKWRDAISSEEWATHESLASIKDFDNIAKNYVEAQKLISNQNKIPAPDPNWTHKEWQEWNKTYGSKFGYPEDPNGYDIGKPEDFPEGLNYNQDAEEFFKREAHQNGLTKAQANKMWKSLIKNTADGSVKVIDTHNAKKKAEWDDLEKELGNAYKEKLKATENFINRMDEDGSFRKWMKDSGASKEANLVKFAMKLSENFKEDSITKDPLGTPEAINTPREAESKLNKIYNDPKHAFHDNFNPEHENAVKEVERLFTEAHPEDNQGKGKRIPDSDLRIFPLLFLRILFGRGYPRPRLEQSTL